VNEVDPAAIAPARLEAALGYEFADRSLLEHALQHSSYAHDHAGVSSNERLEFLGDSVVGLVVANALYRAKPDWAEGDLTRALHALVERRSLADLARTLDVGAHLRLGRTELQSAGETKKSILADAMEAVIGAMYLDGGLVAVTDFIERVFADAFAADAPPVARDPKTELQERAMGLYGEFPTYQLLKDTEIEGDDDRFEVEARLCGEPLSSGVGRTKRAAERRAARRALAGWVEPESEEG
jgi:ribonuclease-3